jgi:hypothetical protein
VKAPALPVSVFTPVPRGETVLFDIAGKKATSFGPGSLPSFSPDDSRITWVAGTPGAEGDVKYMDFSTGKTTDLGKGRFARFLDADHITFFARGNEKVSVDLRTGASAPIDGTLDDTRYFERLDAARSTTPDGFRITRRDDPKATPLPRGGSSSSLFRVVDRTGAPVLDFTAFAAVPAGRGTVAVASTVRNETVNLFLVDIATGRADFIATTRFSLPGFPFAGNDARIAWVDNFCASPSGHPFVYERQTKRLVEVDTTGGPAWWVDLTPSGDIAVGEFGAQFLIDPLTFAPAVRLPDRTGTLGGGADTAWTRDYRYAAYGSSGGHGGHCG